MSTINVILIQSVDRLGKIGDIVSIKSGYARNYLIPKGKAKFATKEICEKIEQQKAELELINNQLIDKALIDKSHLDELTIEISCMASETGQLFGSVTNKEIADAIDQKTGIKINKECICLDRPIKTIGEHVISIKLHPDVLTQLTIVTTYS